MKATRFLGTSREDLAAFPEEARRRAGHELFLVQVGREPSDFKPMPIVGSGAYEIRLQHKSGAYRVIYVAKFSNIVFILHAFQKKSQETSRMDLELATRRYRSIGAQR